MPVEWRGGVLGLIIDEAVLNTREYATARRFIREQYFVKAIISLPRDAFADLAKTTAKTSILLLIRKADAEVVQREPIFFARAENTGPSGNDLKRPNDLVAVCGAFDVWRQKVLDACKTTGMPVPSSTDTSAAADLAAATAAGVGQIALRMLDPTNMSERLDEAYWFMKELIAAIPQPIPLSDVADLVSEGRIPPEQAIYPFASVSRIEGRVRPKGETSTAYSVDHLQEVLEGDILVSGIDLVHGSVGVVGPDCDRMVVSKEYIILRAKDGYDAHWLVSLLRTGALRRIIEGTITGTSNRTRVESADVLMSIQIPVPPPVEIRNTIGESLRSAHKHYALMIESVREAETEAAKAAALPFDIGADDFITAESLSAA